MFTRREKNGYSYVNLISHINESHPEYINHIDAGLSSFEMSVDHFFMNKKSTHYYEWLKIVVHEHVPFNTVEGKGLANNPKFEPISISTMMIYLRILTCVVEEKVTHRLLEKVALVFNG